MIITCGQCQAKFKVAPEQIKETGSKVRCSNCQYIFMVYRPQRPAAKASAAASGRAQAGSGRAGKLDDFLKGLDDRKDGFDDGLGDLFRDRPDDRPPARPAAEADHEDSGDMFAGNPPDDGQTMKERRDRRRQLYADLGGDLPETGDEDEASADDIFGGDQDGRPSLRRGRAAAEQGRAGDFDQDFEELPGEDEDEEDEPGGEEAGDDGDGEDDGEYGDEDEEDGDAGDEEDEEEGEEYEEYEDDEEGEGDGEDDGEYEEDEPEARSGGDDLGLSADPMGLDREPDSPRSKGGVAIGSDAREPAVVRPAITRAKKSASPRLLLILAIVAAILAIGIYFLAGRPEPTALSTGEDSAPAGQAAEGRNPDDSTGTESITFTKNQQSHYFRDNAHAGKILIITGMVHNSYAEPRSFIRLRGLLLNAANETLADRFAYAGNIISEEELTTLPMNEILARLSVKGGQNGLNMNIEPNKGVPFMLVFDKLPEGMEQYRIDPVGSAPAN